MTADQKRHDDVVSRRKFIAASGAAGIAGLAGCTGGQDGGNETTADESGGNDEESGSDETQSQDTEQSSNEGPSLLTAEGSSTVYPISNKGASYWVSNAPPSDGEYWGANDEGSVPGWDELGQPDMKIADYFASLYGFETTGKRSKPPFVVNVGLSHSGTGCKAVRDGLVDIGNSSGPITAELGISESERDENYVDHVVGRDGQPVVVSSDVSDAGVTQLTGEQIRKIYQDEITNWSELGGPDQEIYCVGRAEGSGTDTSFRLNMLGDANAAMPGVDTRQGQNHGVRQVIQQNDGAIGYMALAFTNDQVRPVAIDFDGTVYKTSRDADHTIFDSDYPLNRDLHMYTTITDDTPSGTDRREAAFINMFLTSFGQQLFVEDNNYIPLPTKDIESEKAKLPEQA
ncbi:substrate-binding domain-containing protein [Halorussus litoreus]|uniref:substrate-binding domain-containing protein n=1 Tax=Halorussus litoreus TaxID=1710536 RepID=UPI000E26F550|nr:substrate-binding domain-containing protein [Halorussus litoreus]